MCEQCYSLNALLESAESNPHSNYAPVMRFLLALEEQGRVEVFAGDCSLRDAFDILKAEEHYTVCHYLRCKTCGAIYFVGACIRGTPIYKRIDRIEDETISNVIWGHTGVYFHA